MQGACFVGNAESQKGLGVRPKSSLPVPRVHRPFSCVEARPGERSASLACVPLGAVSVEVRPLAAEAESCRSRAVAGDGGGRDGQDLATAAQNKTNEFVQHVIGLGVGPFREG